MNRWSIILVPWCFSRQGASNDTHDDQNGPTLQFDPDHGQGHHIAMNFITCGATPPKWPVLSECCKFSQSFVTS